MPNRPNRRRSLLRETPKDLAASSDRLGLGDCGCRERIYRRGSITDCAEFAEAIPRFSFSLPSAGIPVDGAGLIPGGPVIVDWATDCRWESDELEVDCGSYTSDSYIWVLEAAKGCCESRLFLERTAGTACELVTLEFRNPFPFLSLGTTLFAIHDYSINLDIRDICTVCLRPDNPLTCIGDCDFPAGFQWESTVLGNTYRTDSPAIETPNGAPGECISFSAFDVWISGAKWMGSPHADSGLWMEVHVNCWENNFGGHPPITGQSVNFYDNETLIARYGMCCNGAVVECPSCDIDLSADSASCGNCLKPSGWPDSINIKAVADL